MHCLSCFIPVLSPVVCTMPCASTFYTCSFSFGMHCASYFIRTYCLYYCRMHCTSCFVHIVSPLVCILSPIHRYCLSFIGMHCVSRFIEMSLLWYAFCVLLCIYYLSYNMHCACVPVVPVLQFLN